MGHGKELRGPSVAHRPCVEDPWPMVYWSLAPTIPWYHIPGLLPVAICEGLHLWKIKEIQSVAECWPINGQNWAITLMWIRPLGDPMLRWTKACKTLWVKEHFKTTASTYLYQLTGNKFLKQTQDLRASHTCQTENNDKVFLTFWSRNFTFKF